MAISLIREVAQKQKVTLTPQLKKSIDLLQLSRYEIIQKINEKLIPKKSCRNLIIFKN